MGLEGMVSKHRESLYRGGRFRHACGLFNLDPGCSPLAIAGERIALVE